MVEHIASFLDQVLTASGAFLAGRIDEFKDLLGELAPHLGQSTPDQFGRIRTLGQLLGSEV
jgi:hypothetical protein